MDARDCSTTSGANVNRMLVVIALQRPVDKQAIERLVAAKLAEMRDGRPIITPMGRKAVVRGSPSLWDTSG
jgi:hypothetical protein